MCNRAELEGLIVLGVEEVKRLEIILNRRWARIAAIPNGAGARKSFLLSLAEFKEQASRLEGLLDALEQKVHRAGPLAA